MANATSIATVPDPEPGQLSVNACDVDMLLKFFRRELHCDVPSMLPELTVTIPRARVFGDTFTFSFSFGT